MRIGLFCIAATPIFISYHWATPPTSTCTWRSAIGWMIARWKSDLSYGGIIPTDI
ncbi:MAG: hypothetical protein U1G05_00245 [Kiritimatiellia bacterium]